MRKASITCKVLMWITFVVYAAMQLGAAFSIQFVYNAKIAAAGKPEEMYNAVPLVVATAVMTAAVILFTVWKKRRYVGLLLAALAWVAILVIGLDLGREFPSRVSSGNITTGLDTTKVVLRHIGIVLVPILMLPAWLCERAAVRRDRLRREQEEKKGYNLSGGPLFTDDGSPVHSLKRSVRDRIRKAPANGDPPQETAGSSDEILK